MAEGRLGGVRTTGSGNFTAYGPVPANKMIKAKINVYSELVVIPNKVKLAISTNATTPAAGEFIQYDEFLADNDIYERDGVILKAGEYVIVNSDAAGVTCTVSGITYDSDSDFVQKTSITTNTTTEVYQAPVGKTVAANLSVTVDGGVSDIATVEVFISSDGTPDNGELIQKQLISPTSISGFERAGLILKAQDRILIRTTGIAGSLSVRIHGFERAEVA